MLKKNKKVCFSTVLFLFIFTVNPFISANIQFNSSNDKSNEIFLPTPIDVDMVLEQAIFMRKSVREYTNQPVTQEELSTILWAAYGLRDDGDYTVSDINGIHSSVIYVFDENAVYTYNPTNHSLVSYKEGDHRNKIDLLQYDAPIQLGLCWDTDKADANKGATELGQIGQNIQFTAVAISLGTVVTGQTPPAIKPVGLPSNHEGLIIMPLGHPKDPYSFTYRPMYISLLPRVKYSDLSLYEAIKNRKNYNNFEGKLTRNEKSQVVWSSYGYSYLIDHNIGPLNVISRHRTVPSAHGYYPLKIYVATPNGVYFYNAGLYNIDKWGLPVFNFFLKIINIDKRSDIADASGRPDISSAPMVIIPTLDLEATRKWDDLSDPSLWRFWYYEAGACAHNVLLESTALNLKGDIIYLDQYESIRSILRIDENYVPMLLVPIGK